jgi:hypothetical protein
VIENYSTLEFVYPDHVTAYRDFLLREIDRLHASAAIEIEQMRVHSPALLQAKRRDLLQQTKPLEDDLVQLLSTSIWNIRLSP